MGQDQAAHQPEEPRDQQRDEKRAFKRVADRQGFAGQPPADQPLAIRQAVNDQGGLPRRGLPMQSDEAVVIALLKRPEVRRQTVEIALHLVAVGAE